MCAHIQPALHQLLDTYKGKVRLAYKYFPLTTMHKNALPSAHAAQCAAEQNQFWAYEDQLFQTQPQWAVLADPTTSYVAIAQDGASRHESRFNACYADPSKLAPKSNKIAPKARPGRSRRPPHFSLEMNAWSAWISKPMAPGSSSGSSGNDHTAALGHGRSRRIGKMFPHQILLLSLAGAHRGRRRADLFRSVQSTIAPSAEFAAALAAYHVLPSGVIPTVTLLWPWLELLVGTYVFFGYFTRLFAAAAAATMFARSF